MTLCNLIPVDLSSLVDRDVITVDAVRYSSSNVGTIAFRSVSNKELELSAEQAIHPLLPRCVMIPSKKDVHRVNAILSPFEA